MLFVMKEWSASLNCIPFLEQHLGLNASKVSGVNVQMRRLCGSQDSLFCLTFDGKVVAFFDLVLVHKRVGYSPNAWPALPCQSRSIFFGFGLQMRGIYPAGEPVGGLYQIGVAISGAGRIESGAAAKNIHSFSIGKDAQHRT